MGVVAPQQDFVEITQRPQYPSGNRIYRFTKGLGSEQLKIFEDYREQGCSWPGSYSYIDDFEIGNQLPQTIYRPSAVIGGIQVNRMAERHDDVQITPRLEHPKHL